MAKAPNPVAVPAAIIRYAPPSVTRVANSVLNPELDRLVAMVTARPKSIRRVPASLIANVFARINSVEVLAALINVGDKRIVMRDNLTKHPKYVRAYDLTIEKAHRWADFDIDTVSKIIDEILRDRHLMNDDIRNIVTWCRRQNPDRRAEAYRRIYQLEPNGRTAFSELYIDVLIGSVPGLTPEGLGVTVDPEQPYKIPSGRTYKQDAMKAYPRLTLQLAQVCSVNGHTIPLESVDVIDPDAFEFLLRSAGVVNLLEKGLLDDPQRLLPFIDAFDERLRVQLAQRITDPVVVAALIKDIPYGKRTYVDLFPLLNNVPDLDRDTRMVLITYASNTELRDYLNGMTLNQPEPGDGEFIVRSILDPSAPRWNNSGAGSIAYTLGVCSPTPVALEAVNTFLDIAEGMTDTILGNQGLLGRVAVERIIAAFGSEQEKWEMLLRLSADWTGNLDTLIATASLL
jgi:hypothetical protein